MKKSYVIFIREVNHIFSYFPEETVKKHYQLGFNNSFFTYQEAVNFINDENNAKFFNENQQYFVLELFEKL